MTGIGHYMTGRLLAHLTEMWCGHLDSDKTVGQTPCLVVYRPNSRCWYVHLRVRRIREIKREKERRKFKVS